MKKFSDWKIQNKLLTVIAPLVIVPFTLFTFLATYQFSASLKRSAENDLEHVVRTLSALCEISLGTDQAPEVFAARLAQVKAVVKGIVIGETGYPYVIDRMGTFVIHPFKEGENVSRWKDSEGNYIIRTMIAQALASGGRNVGEIRYPWINVELGEKTPRMKITKFHYLPILGWIIAAGSYEEEIFRAVRQTEEAVIVLTASSVALVLALLVFLARLLARPILELTRISSRMAEGEFSLRAEISQADEIGMLAQSFNRMGAQIEEHTRTLEEAVRQRTQELVESKERYQETSTLLTNVLESSTEYAIIATDLQWRILEFNTGARKLFGWTKTEITAESIAKTYTEKLDVLFSEAAYQALLEGEAVEKEIDRRTKYGDLFLSRSVMTAMRDAEGRLIGYLEISRDVTERKRLERELMETKDYLENILNSSVDGIITTDIKGNITYINRGMEEILHARKEQYVGTHVSHLYADGIAEARRIMSVLRREQQFDNYEMTILDEKGKEIPINTSAALLKNFDGKIIGTVGIFKDMTERYKLQAKLDKAEASLIQAAKMRELGDLVSGVAHEINNPLMASQTMLYRIKQNTEEQHHANCPNKKLIDLVERCNERIGTIVNHLREFSRETETRLEPLDVTVPISNALLITAQQLLDHGIVITKDLSEGAPRVRGNAPQLEQVFLNIISNARDALDREVSGKELIIRSFCRSKPGAAGEVVVSFTDTGPGILPEHKYKIFDPFFSTKEVGHGTGLGLAICYGIVEKHGGRIEVDSEVGKGATFRVVLPAIEESL